MLDMATLTLCSHVDVKHQSEIIFTKQLVLATNCMMHDYLSFSITAATSIHFHTVGNASHLSSLNWLCACSHWAKKIEWRVQVGDVDKLWCSCHTMGKLTNGPISQKHGVGLLFQVFISRHSDSILNLEKEVVHLCTSITKKRLPRHQQPQEIKQLSTERATIGWWLLLRHLVCSTTHVSASLGSRPQVHCWEQGRKSMLPFLLILWHCFPLFPGSDIHLCGKFAAGGFQGASVIRTSHSLPFSLSSLSN